MWLLLCLVGLFLGAISAVGFVIGAVLSGVAGYIGMNISVRSNVRTAQGASDSLQTGLTVAFRAGAVTGMLVAGLALAGYFDLLLGADRTNGAMAPNDRVVIDALVALGFWCIADFNLSPVSVVVSLPKRQTLALTWSAKSKLEFQKMIRATPPPSPIMLATMLVTVPVWLLTLFETYVVTVGATMVLLALLVGDLVGAEMLGNLMALPLIIGGACIITSIIGTYMVRLGGGTNIMGALYKGFITTAVLSIPALYYVTMADAGWRHEHDYRCCS